MKDKILNGLNFVNQVSGNIFAISLSVALTVVTFKACKYWLHKFETNPDKKVKIILCKKVDDSEENDNSDEDSIVN